MPTRTRPRRHPIPAAGARSAVAALLAAGAASLLVALLACSLPGRPVVVLPALAGALVASPPGSDGRMVLVLVHRDTPALHARRESALDQEGRFAFEPILLDVAGQELGKHYRVHLHLRVGGTDRVVWRADVARSALGPPIRLACDLARPIALGEPCRVEEPLAQPWLLAEGRRQFERLCDDCHGGPDAPARTQQPAPDLSRIAERNGGRFERDAVAAWIEGRTLAPAHRRGGMPVWGERLSAEFERYVEGEALIGATLDPLVAYLESLQPATARAGPDPQGD